MARDRRLSNKHGQPPGPPGLPGPPEAQNRVIFFWPKCFLCSGGSLASSKIGKTCLKVSFYQPFLLFFGKNLIFCLWRVILFPEIKFFGNFLSFFKNFYPFFLMNG
jgi:hypothetical protein